MVYGWVFLLPVSSRGLSPLLFLEENLKNYPSNKKVQLLAGLFYILIKIIKIRVYVDIKLYLRNIKIYIIIKYHSKEKLKPILNKLKIGGSSPPSIFIGRYGYPKVSIGPMIPPVIGDTSIIILLNYG